MYLLQRTLAFTTKGSCLLHVSAVWQQHSKLLHCCFNSKRTRTCMPVLACHPVSCSTVLSGQGCSRLCTRQQHVQKALFKASSFVRFVSLSTRCGVLPHAWWLAECCSSSVILFFLAGLYPCTSSMFMCKAAAVPSRSIADPCSTSWLCNCTACTASWLLAVCVVPLSAVVTTTWNARTKESVMHRLQYCALTSSAVGVAEVICSWLLLLFQHCMHCGVQRSE